MAGYGPVSLQNVIAFYRTRTARIVIPEGNVRSHLDHNALYCAAQFSA